jgi:hypothetical protein
VSELKDNNLKWKRRSEFQSLFAQIVSFSDGFSSIKNVDLNNDGILDMVFVVKGIYNRDQKPVYSEWLFFQGSGDDRFFSGFSIFSGDKKSSNYFASGDINVIDFGDFFGNGKKGVVWVDRDDTVNVYSYKSFLSDPVKIVVKDYDVTTVTAGDFNGDGYDDIALAGYSPNHYNEDKQKYEPEGFIQIYETKIEGNELLFKRVKDFTFSNSKLVSMASIDFDGDGLKDIIVLSSDDGSYLVKGDRGSNYDLGTFVSSPDIGNITVVDFDHKGGDDFVFFTKNSAMVYMNHCIPVEVKKCKVCENGNKSRGDANCDEEVDLVDFEIWRKEFFDIEDKGYDWKADFNCKDEPKQPDSSDFNVWITNFFSV